MTPRRYMPALLLLFVGSGCAALIYEIVWFQLLQLVIGSSAVSLAVLLGTFMGGMCLGSFLLPRYVSAREHPLRVYAYPRAGHRRARDADPLRRAGAGEYLYRVGRIGAVTGILLRGVAAAILPAAADDVDGRDAAGDVALRRDDPAGRVVARLLLRRQHRRRRHREFARRFLSAARLRPRDRDLRRRRRSTFSSPRFALLVARVAPYGPVQPRTRRSVRAPGAWAVYVAIALSGMTALASEVHLDADCSRCSSARRSIPSR